MVPLLQLQLLHVMTLLVHVHVRTYGLWSVLYSAYVRTYVRTYVRMCSCPHVVGMTQCIVD